MKYKNYIEIVNCRCYQEAVDPTISYVKSYSAPQRVRPINSD